MEQLQLAYIGKRYSYSLIHTHNRNYDQVNNIQHLFFTTLKNKKTYLSQAHTFHHQMLAALFQFGFSKTYLARKLKISRTTIYRVLNGKTQNLRLYNFTKLFKFYCLIVTQTDINFFFT